MFKSSQELNVGKRNNNLLCIYTYMHYMVWWFVHFAAVEGYFQVVLKTKISFHNYS